MTRSPLHPITRALAVPGGLRHATLAQLELLDLAVLSGRQLRYELDITRNGKIRQARLAEFGEGGRREAGAGRGNHHPQYLVPRHPRGHQKSPPGGRSRMASDN